MSLSSSNIGDRLFQQSGLSCTTFGFGGTLLAPLKGSGIEGCGLLPILTPLNGSAGAGVLDLNGSGTPCFTVHSAVLLGDLHMD